MIKVLNVISDSNIGGAGKSLLAYLKNMDKSRFQAAVALPRAGALLPELSALGVQALELDITPDKSFDIAAIKQIKAAIKQASPDIVHTHGSLSARIAAKRCGCKVVFTRHTAFSPDSRDLRQPYNAAFRFINARYADRVIAVSEDCRLDMIKRGVSSDKISVVLNGCEPVDKVDIQEREKLRRSYMIPQGAFALGSIARIEQYKGHKCMLDAVQELKKLGLNVFLIIAGTGSFEPEVKRYAGEIGVESNVYFPGFVSDTPSLYNSLDVQLNASFLEATSMSLIEGLSIGLPAIASRCGGNPYVITDGVSGRLFDTGSSHQLAEAVRSLYQDKLLYSKLSQGAQAEYSARFTGSVFAKGIEKVYTDILEGTKNAE